MATIRSTRVSQRSHAASTLGSAMMDLACLMTGWSLESGGTPNDHPDHPERQTARAVSL